MLFRVTYGRGKQTHVYNVGPEGKKFYVDEAKWMAKGGTYACVQQRASTTAAWRTLKCFGRKMRGR